MTLPEGWVETTLGNVAETKLGKMLDAAKNRGNLVPYLRNVNVRWGEFDVTELPEIRASEDEIDALSVQNGDVFVCEGGEPGRCAVWRAGSQRIIFQKALHRLRPINGVNSEYLAMYLSYVVRSDGVSYLFTGTTIKHLPQVALQRIKLPLPPSQEQERIVKKLGSLLGNVTRAQMELSKVAGLSSAGARARALLDRLEAAILAKAFRGELVPQDANDEPASVLLDRSRAERAAAPKPKRGRTRKTIG